MLAPVPAVVVNAGQGVQAALPLAEEYVPWAQSWHGPPFGPDVPGMHAQLAALVAPETVLLLFVGHGVQAVLPVVAA